MGCTRLLCIQRFSGSPSRNPSSNGRGSNHLSVACHTRDDLGGVTVSTCNHVQSLFFVQKSVAVTGYLEFSAFDLRDLGVPRWQPPTHPVVYKAIWGSPHFWPTAMHPPDNQQNLICSAVAVDTLVDHTIYAQLPIQTFKIIHQETNYKQLNQKLTLL